MATTTFTGTATTSPATLTIDTKLTSEVFVQNTGSVALLVNVPAVHGTTSFDTLDAGEGEYYSASSNIGSVIVKTSSSTTTYRASVTRGRS